MKKCVKNYIKMEKVAEFIWKQKENGGGFIEVLMLRQKMYEKKYSKLEKVAEYIWKQCCDTKFVKKL